MKKTHWLRRLESRGRLLEKLISINCWFQLCTWLCSSVFACLSVAPDLWRFEATEIKFWREPLFLWSRVDLAGGFCVRQFIIQNSKINKRFLVYFLCAFFKFSIFCKIFLYCVKIVFIESIHFVEWMSLLEFAWVSMSSDAFCIILFLKEIRWKFLFDTKERENEVVPIFGEDGFIYC